MPVLLFMTLKNMKRAIFLTCAAGSILLAAVGCQPKDEAAPASNTTAEAQSGGDSVSISTPSAVPNAPVTGSESLQGGGGGGVAQAAKDRARGAASSASGSSIDQAGGD
ncbi:MAG TPA: hypothetical protein VEX38_00650 [Fimbriimonadaceae bacterium]|nr:hypothetical protein [Fimbriimonadaceae bacterium]